MLTESLVKELPYCKTALQLSPKQLCSWGLRKHQIASQNSSSPLGSQFQNTLLHPYQIEIVTVTEMEASYIVSVLLKITRLSHRLLHYQTLDNMSIRFLTSHLADFSGNLSVVSLEVKSCDSCCGDDLVRSPCSLSLI